MKTLHFLIVSLALGAFASSSQSAVLVSYSFAGNGLPGSVAGNATANTAIWNFDGNPPGGSFGFSLSSSTAFANMSITAGSLDLQDYLEIGISAESGYVLNLNSLTFVFGGSVAVAAYSGAVVSSQVRSNAESSPFSTSLMLEPGSTTVASTAVPNTNVTVWNTFTIDLSGADFQELGGVLFRFYIYDDINNGQSYVRFDNIALEGEVVPIPEPSAGILTGVAFLLLALGRATRKLRA